MENSGVAEARVTQCWVGAVQRQMENMVFLHVPWFPKYFSILYVSVLLPASLSDTGWISHPGFTDVESCRP